MAGGLLLTVAALLSPWLPHGRSSQQFDVGLWLACSSLCTLWLLISVGRLARHRFFSPADINGSGLREDTSKAVMLQTLLQNTLEQTVLAVVAYGAWLALGPPGRSGLVIVFTGYFAIGRLLFYAGYSHGAAARALGFTLTFYPSAALLVGASPAALLQVATALRV